MDSRLKELLLRDIGSRSIDQLRLEQYEGAAIFFPESDSEDAGYAKYRKYCGELGLEPVPTLVAVDKMLPNARGRPTPAGRYWGSGNIVVISKKLFDDFRKDDVFPNLVIGHELGHAHHRIFSRRRLLTAAVAQVAVASGVGAMAGAATHHSIEEAQEHDLMPRSTENLAGIAGLAVGIGTASATFAGLLLRAKMNARLEEEFYAERKAAKILGSGPVFLLNWREARHVIFSDAGQLAEAREEFRRDVDSNNPSARAAYDAMGEDEKEIAFGLHALRKYRQIAEAKSFANVHKSYPSSVGHCMALAKNVERELYGKPNSFSRVEGFGSRLILPVIRHVPP